MKMIDDARKDAAALRKVMGPSAREAVLTPTPRRSGFFDLPRTAKCLDPGHEFPTMIHIPPGKGYTHVCPSCGKSVTVHGQGASL